MTLIAIMSGGDWADASVDHLVLPTGMDIELKRIEYEEWYRTEYHKGGIAYKSFPQFLEQQGARAPTEEELTIFWERP
jgi:hypothetical protein